MLVGATWFQLVLTNWPVAALPLFACPVRVPLATLPLQKKSRGAVEQKLNQRIPELTLIKQQEIEDWMDRNDWDEIDYVELSKGLGCDFLIAVDFDNFSLYEGQTLYKGRSDIGVTVFETETESVVFRLEPTMIQFPANSGQHTADTRESEFRNRYLDVISSFVARQFYSYDVKEDYAQDPTFVTN